ncbi:MAG: dTDP-4-dehydrorhamnose 3,5-epimerase [Ramlibacter sp.]|nr:dTDP-4-dehydrorhamnose 3,5-epimerase [Ramlibacter sp.]
MGGVKLRATALAGVYVAEEPHSVADHRGFLRRLYSESELAPALGERRIAQINHTCTRKTGAVRGLHLQRPPHAETKFIRCLQGRVWDVAVDLRSGSPTFLQWHAEELSPANGRMLIIPEGCAHGFQALEPESELLYLHTASYAPAAEAGFSCTDARLAIRWPLPVVDLSARDAAHPPIGADFTGIAP